MLAGCGLTAEQRTAARRFSKATAALGKQVGDELPAMRRANIELNKYRVALGTTWSQTDKDLDNKLDEDATRIRVGAAKTLQAYGELLWALVKDSQEQELKSAADTFADRVKGLDTNRTLSDDQLDAIGALVYAIGDLFVEEMKAKAVKKIVSESTGQVATLCDLIHGDFSVGGGGYATEILTTSSNLLRESNSYLGSHQGVVGRAVAIEAYHTARTYSKRHQSVHAGIAGAALQMKKANDALAAALTNKSFKMDDIKSFVESVKDAFDASKALANE